MNASRATSAGCLRTAAVVFFVLQSVVWTPAAAAAGPRSLRVADGRRTQEGWLVELAFTSPLRYTTHSPRSPGTVVRIELRTIGVGRAAEIPLSPGDVLRPFSGNDAPPIDSIATLAPAAGQGLVVELRFTRETEFEIRQGSDLQRLEILLPDASAARGPSYEGVAATLLQDAKRALAAGDAQRAIQLYTRVLSMNAPSAHPEALEMLGVARERAGQRAHARAEYERFLERHPDDERAPRVRQRLSALATASATLPDEPLRASSRAARVDVNGSLLSYYSRAQGFFDDDLGNVVYDSSWFTDLFVRARLRTDALEVEASAAGRTRLDFQDDGIGSDSRLSGLLVEASERGTGWWGNVGRQRGDGGVIGRFDGARLGYRSDRVELQVIGGMPLESYASDRINTDRWQIGAAGRVLDVASLVDVEVYVNYQREADLTYRAAIGTELRHLRSGRTIVASLDYDAYFNVVNIASLLGNQQINDSLSINGLVEYRKSPIVTMGNARIGQQGESLEALRATFSESELKQLAKDRSGNATLFSAGARYDLNDRMDVSGSFSASSLGGTEASGGVPAVPGTGYELGYLAQLGIRSLLLDGDTSTFGVRIFDGGRADRYMLEAIGRYPILPRLRLNPIVRLEYEHSQADYVRLAPRLRVDYAWWELFLDLDLAYQWTRGVADGERPTEHTYSIAFGVRWDF